MSQKCLYRSGFDVDFLLGRQERAEVAIDVLDFCVSRDEEAHDKASVDELAEAELLQQAPWLLGRAYVDAEIAWAIEKHEAFRRETKRLGATAGT